MMLWAAFCSHRKTKLVQAHMKLSGKEYVKMQEKDMIGWGDENWPVNWIFMQKSTPAHSAKVAQNAFMGKEFVYCSGPYNLLTLID